MSGQLALILPFVKGETEGIFRNRGRDPWDLVLPLSRREGGRGGEK
jgi:hypothetical protein